MKQAKIGDRQRERIHKFSLHNMQQEKVEVRLMYADFCLHRENGVPALMLQVHHHHHFSDERKEV